MGSPRGLGAWAGVEEAKTPLGPCLPHSKFPQTATEWAEILALQKQFHSVEVHKWRQILRASVELLDEVRPGLRGLQSCPQMWHNASGPRFPPVLNEEAIHSPHLPGLLGKSVRWKIQSIASHPGEEVQDVLTSGMAGSSNKNQSLLPSVDSAHPQGWLCFRGIPG